MTENKVRIEDNNGNIYYPHTKSDVVFMSDGQSIEEKVTEHLDEKNNPHGVTKTQVGLGSVQNYGVATQAEAEAGTSAAKYMTPERTSQAIDKKLTPLNETFTEHLDEDASTIQKGHVQLSNDTNSTSETLAPTMKALNEVKQFANDGKKAVANAVTAKGVTASPSDTFPTLATKIGQIGGGIKRVQRGEVEVTTQQVFDIPISAVVYGNSIVRISSAVQYSASVHAFRAELLNDTTVRLTRNHSAASGPMRVVWEVVEFEKVKRIQRGSNVVWGETNIAINAVDLSKTMVVCSFSSRVTDVTRIDATTMEHLLTSPTNLRLFYRPVDATAHYQIVEF